MAARAGGREASRPGTAPGTGRPQWRRLAVHTTLASVAALAVLSVATTAQADVLADLEAPFREALESGSFGMALGLVFVAGLATSLTPCVYPMIVITVSVFGARQARSRMQAAMLSTSFVLGMAALFTPLGVISALTGNVFGSFLANPWVLGGLALLFVLLAAAMFGAFELNLPPALQNRLAQVGGSGYRGSFALGFVSGLVAAPCTGPVVGLLLGWVGTTGNVTFGGLSLFAYALGLGTLFWLVGVFAVSLPKSGRWLEWVKSVFGVIMLVMALYFIRDLLPVQLPHERSVPWIAIACALTVAGLLIGAIHLSFQGSSRVTKARKGMGITMAVGGLFAAVAWVQAVPSGAKIAWIEDYEQARELAQQQNRPLLVDFGASWCGACGELDRHTFSDPRVVAEAEDFVPVRIDLSADQQTPEKWALLRDDYQQPGLPLVVLHDRQGQEAERITSFVEPDEFLQVLRRID